MLALRLRLAQSSPPVLTYIGGASKTADAQNFTFSTQNIGTAAEDRIVVVAAGRFHESATGALSSAQIGGASATIAAASASNVASSALFYRLMPTGTTATIYVDWAANSRCMRIEVYTITGLISATPGDTLTDIDADPTTGTIDISAGGVCIGQAVSGEAGSGDHSWTGLTEDNQVVLETQQYFSSASASDMASESGRTVECDNTSATRSSMAVASWR